MERNKNQGFIGAVILVVITLIIIIFLVITSFTGLPIKTGNGNQVGYVSAVENQGLIWKTGRVYIKPTLESTQEDIYCVIDEEVKAKLEIASIEQSRIKVNHYSVFSAGVTNCQGETAIIKSIDILD